MILIALLILPWSAPACTVVDGDTVRCGKERVRLLGIDAPEIHGCRQGRICAPGDGQASKRNLQRLLNGSLRIDRVTRDRYGRTVAQVYAGGRNVSCEQLRAGMARYERRWDNGRRLAKECRDAIG